MALIVVCGCKGGVGVSTVAAGLVAKAPVPVLAMDLTGTGDIGAYLGRDMVGAGELVRKGAERLQEILRRQQSLLVVFTEQDRALYPDAPVTIARAAMPLRTVIVDAGLSVPQGLLGITTDVVLVAAPDIRAVRRLNQMMMTLRSVRTVVLENLVESETLLAQSREIRMAKPGFRSLMRGQMGQVLHELAVELIPAPPEPEEEQGIIRSAVRRLAAN